MVAGEPVDVQVRLEDDDPNMNIIFETCGGAVRGNTIQIVCPLKP